MSGKAPPTGPRALRVTDQGSSSGSASSSSPAIAPPLTSPKQPQLHPQPPKVQSSSTSAHSGSRIGAAPPTGPRSLQANNHARQPPGSKHLFNGHSNPLNSGGANGLASHALQMNRHPISIKGKKRDLGLNAGVCHFVAVHNIPHLALTLSRGLRTGNRLTPNLMVGKKHLNSMARTMVACLAAVATFRRHRCLLQLLLLAYGPES